MNKYLILIVVSSLCAVTVARCPFNDEKEWKEFHNYCYYFSETMKPTWELAKTYCHEQRNGSHLADILSEEENRWVQERLNGYRYSEDYYIGATDLEVEGVFRWDNTGTILSYTNWADGEPNQWMGDPENCVEIQTHSGRWNDVPCDMYIRFICKRASVRN